MNHVLSFYWKIKILKKKNPGDIISLHLCTKNDNHMMYGSLDIRCNRQNFLWTIFCPFNPPKNLKNQYFYKMKKKKITGDVIICTVNAWMKVIWCMVSEIWNVTDWIFLTLDYFLPFYSPKNHSFDKMKKTTQDIIILYMCTINKNHMMYVFWDIKHDRLFCYFGPFFALLHH